MSSRAIPAAHPDLYRVLIASSDPKFRNRSIPETEGQQISIEEALSGAQAISKLRTLAFDLLILDRRLPDLDAEEVAEIVRKKFPDLRIQLADSSDLPEEKPELPIAVPFRPLESSERARVSVASPLPAENEGLPGMVGQGHGRCSEGVPAGQTRRAAKHACANRRRNRHWQGVGCKSRPSDQPPEQKSAGSGQLRRHSRGFARS